MDIYSIYKVTNMVNKKIYIGFDSNWPARKKSHYYNHRSKSCPNYHFYNALKKYGWNNFKWEVIYQSKDRDHTLNIMENKFIEEYDTHNNGYNRTYGGEGTFGKKQSKENKNKQSKLRSDLNKKSHWYNNGIQNIFTHNNPGKEWKLGRLFDSKKCLGRKWYNNGITQKLLYQCPENWKEGMIK